MLIGITLLFKYNNHSDIKGVLKSLVLDINDDSLLQSINSIGVEISLFYNYSYLGINDLFVVSNYPKENELLGRSTFYNLDSIHKSKKLTSNDFVKIKYKKSAYLNFSLIYFCENHYNERYTISIISVVKNDFTESITDKINKIAINNSLINKIKSLSIDEIKNIKYIGIEYVHETDLKFNVFQTFFSNSENLNSLKKELLNTREIDKIMLDIRVNTYFFN